MRLFISNERYDLQYIVKYYELETWFGFVHERNGFIVFVFVCEGKFLFVFLHWFNSSCSRRRHVQADLSYGPLS